MPLTGQPQINFKNRKRYPAPVEGLVSDMSKLVTVEKLNLNTTRICNKCDVEKAVARVYGQSKAHYQQHIIPSGTIYFCKKCGPDLAREIEKYSR